jgi:hypothetical protein
MTFVRREPLSVRLEAHVERRGRREKGGADEVGPTIGPVGAPTRQGDWSRGATQSGVAHHES